MTINFCSRVKEIRTTINKKEYYCIYDISFFSTVRRLIRPRNITNSVLCGELNKREDKLKVLSFILSSNIKKSNINKHVSFADLSWNR